MNSEPFWKMLDRALYEAELAGEYTGQTKLGIEAGKKILDSYVPAIGGPVDSFTVRCCLSVFKAAAFLGKQKAKQWNTNTFESSDDQKTSSTLPGISCSSPLERSSPSSGAAGAF